MPLWFLRLLIFFYFVGEGRLEGFSLELFLHLAETEIHDKNMEWTRWYLCTGGKRLQMSCSQLISRENLKLKGNSATRVEYIQFWLVNIACSKNPCVEWLSIGFLANPALKNLTQRAPRYKYNFFYQHDKFHAIHRRMCLTRYFQVDFYLTTDRYQCS